MQTTTTAAPAAVTTSHEKPAVSPAPTFMPGPWQGRKHSSGDGAVVIRDRQGVSIGEVYAGPRLTPEQADANAALIAAAPDLLDALKNMVDIIGPWAMANGVIYSGPCDTARAAIAKAEGRP